MKRSYTLWEMICGIPAMHAQYDREDAEFRMQRREQDGENDYQQFYEEFLLAFDIQPKSGIDSVT